MLSILVLTFFLAQNSSSQSALRVVVIEGEDAVNIIQQKTAVRPVIEVRDRNNLPVAGAIVTFSIEGGKAATFSGASTLTVATNAAGQAAVTGLTPAAAGAFQIQVTAAFQGQVATAAIAQTNVMTAAQAAAASATAGGTSGSSAGTGGGAAGGGGGISGTTIAITGAAIAGGAVAAVKVAENVDDDEIFTGTISGQTVFTGVSRATGQTCVTTRNATATVHFEIDDPRGDRVDGHYESQGTEAFMSQTCSGGVTAEMPFTPGGTFNGTDTAIRGSTSSPFSGNSPDGGTYQGTYTSTFEGARSGEDTIIGTISVESRGTSTSPSGTVFDNAYKGTFPVTLRKTNQ